MEERKTSRYGNKPYQKLKPYVILQYLLRETDENNIQSAEDIKGYLEEQGISAERRSIYRDIDEINLVNVMLEEECTADEAKEMLLNDPDGELNFVVYAFSTPLRNLSLTYSSENILKMEWHKNGTVAIASLLLIYYIGTPQRPRTRGL